MRYLALFAVILSGCATMDNYYCGDSHIVSMKRIRNPGQEVLIYDCADGTAFFDTRVDWRSQ